MDWPTLIAALKEIMSKDGMTMPELAAILGVSVSSARNYLAQRQRASIATREKIEELVEASQKGAAKKPAPKVSTAKAAAKPATDKPAESADKATPKRRRGRPSKAAKAEEKVAAQADVKSVKQPASTTTKVPAKKTTKTPTKTQVVNAETAVTKQEQTAQKAAETTTTTTAPKSKTRRGRGRSNRTEKQLEVETSKPVVKQPAAPKTVTPATTAPQQVQTPVTPAPTKVVPKTVAKATDTSVVESRVKMPVAQKRPNSAVRIYVDESFGQSPEKPFTVGTVLCSVEPGIMPFKEFTDTLYPFGWVPGDEVKAQGKDLKNVEFVLGGSDNKDIRMMAFRTTTVPPMLTITEDDATMVTIFPYVSALTNAIEQMQRDGLKATQFQIIIDRTNKLPTESLHVMQNLLTVYFRLSGAQGYTFHITDGDSRAQKGLQLADFVSHYAYVATPEQSADFKPVTTVVDDMVGNARRFAYYSGLRLVQLRPGTENIAPAAAVVSDNAFETPVAVEDEQQTGDEDAGVTTAPAEIGRAMQLALALRQAIITAQSAGLRGDQLEAVRSRIKGLSKTIGNWLKESQAPLLAGLANRTIADFRERLVIVTRIEMPFRPAAEIGEQQFKIFESQLERIEALLDSYTTTAEA